MEICARPFTANTCKPVTNFTGILSSLKRMGTLKSDVFERKAENYPNRIPKEVWENTKPIEYIKEHKENYVNNADCGMPCHFVDSVNAKPLKKAILPVKTIDVSNFEYPSGSIAVTTDYNQPLSTTGLLSCAGLVIIDKANKKQSLLHCCSGIDARKNRAILEELLKDKNPKDLDISIVNGLYGTTEKTITFLVDNIKDILKEDCPISFRYFPDEDSNNILVKNGNILCAKKSLLKKNTNPQDKIIFAK